MSPVAGRNDSTQTGASLTRISRQGSPDEKPGLTVIRVRECCAAMSKRLRAFEPLW